MTQLHNYRSHTRVPHSHGRSHSWCIFTSWNTS